MRTFLPTSSIRLFRGLPPSISSSSYDPSVLNYSTFSSTFAATIPQQSALFSLQQQRSFVSASTIHSAAAGGDTADKPTKKRKRKFLPPKAAVKLTPKARKFFKALLERPSRPDIVGIMLNYSQASSGQPRMVFSFDFTTQDQITEQDEGVSLEVLEDGESPKPPKESADDGLKKLYVSHNGFMKVLGCTLDVDIETMKPILYDPSGNVMDPNAT